MSKLYQGTENWVFESDNGIKYSIYEGIGYGTQKKTSTDIAFIMLDEYYEDDINTHYIGFLYGAEFITDDDYKNDIERLVNEFERCHQTIVREIGKPESFIDDEEKMKWFFILSKGDFMERYDVFDREYDATAEEVAKRIASVRTWN